MVAGRPPRSFCTGPLPFECGSNDPNPKPKNEGYKLPSFVNNLVTPFMSCWQPPINACGTPQRRGSQAPPTAAVVSPHPATTPQATTNIREPHSNDVLCGRGGSSNRHIGNLNFRSLVAANKDMYVTLTKKQKMMVARKIVEAVQVQDPPGRFLQKDAVTGLWFDIGLPRSLEKTSQALREKTPGSSKETIDAPVSPGGSSVTVTTVESLSDTGVETPVLAKSPPSSPTPDPSTSPSSPPTVPSSESKNALSPNEVPDITIPEHLESQFRPRRQKEARVQRLPRHGHPPYPYHPYHYPPHPHGPPPQPYLHPYPPDPRHDYYHRPHGHPPPHYPYPPPMPMIGERPPYPHARPHYVPSSPHPPSPDRREYQMRDPRQLPSPKTPPSRQQQVPSPMGSGTPSRQSLSHPNTPVHSNKSTGALGRQTGEVSPGRAQVSKKRRTAADEALTHDMAHRLSLQETASSAQDELKSPSNVLQSRVRRGMETAPLSSNSSHHTSLSSPRRISSESRNRGDALAGLAALSSAALLKLDEENK